MSPADQLWTFGVVSIGPPVGETVEKRLPFVLTVEKPHGIVQTQSQQDDDQNEGEAPLP